MKTMCLFMSRAMPMVCCVVMSCLLFCSSVEAQQNRRLDVVALTAFQLSIFPDRDRNGKIEFGTTSTDGADKAIPSDKTTANRPYRFWINNDFDVTNEGGEPVRKIACDEFFTGGDDEQFEQQCEQWDEEATSRNNNTASGQLTRIENIRDLEDFAPLKIKLSPYSPELITSNVPGGPQLNLRMRAVGVGINVFQGVWDDSESGKAHGYLLNEALGRSQVNPADALHIASLPATGEWALVNSSKIRRLINKDGEMNLIFEGVTSSSGCAADASGCYVEVEVISGRASVVRFDKRSGLGSTKLYLDLRDVKDFYDHHTAGNADNSSDFDPDEPSDITLERGRKVDLLEGIPSDASVLESDYVLFVHGWRMRKFEKLGFAETAFKRLYWSGYQGRFGMLSWPTGYFDNPAHIYDVGLFEYLFYLLGNEQNYGDSEVVARQTGLALRHAVPSIVDDNAGAALHIIAHSMGNVVVSEMLRENIPVTSYAASQAAEAAGSYDQSVDHNAYLHTMRLIGPTAADFIPDCNEATEVILENDETGLVAGPEIAWRCYNQENSPFDSPYDMPPDQYRFTITSPHGPTGDSDYPTQGEGLPYYSSVGATRIVNFYNVEDAALTAWEFNQLTKPDNLPPLRPAYEYDNEAVRFLQGLAGRIDSDGNILYEEVINGEVIVTPLPTTPAAVALATEEEAQRFAGIMAGQEQVTDRYYVGDRPDADEPGNLTWTYGSNVYTDDNAEILAHIIPARTDALGQVDTEAGIFLDEVLIRDSQNAPYTDSNQDHSGQFYNSYVIEKAYWQQVLNLSVDLIDSKYSGLRE